MLKASLYDVLQSHHDPRLGFLRGGNSFRTEQNSSVAKLYSSPVPPETLISLMSYDVCAQCRTHTHKHTHGHLNTDPRLAGTPTELARVRYLYKYIFIRVTQGFRNRPWWMVSVHEP